jgi:hypothetical protein
MRFDRQKFFDYVRSDPFDGSLTQSQVDGMEAVLGAWERYRSDLDLRFLAYEFATAFHETGQQMVAIEEWGKGEGHDYGEPDPETGQAYYGRGLVQLTWRENYARADHEIQILIGVLVGMEADADKALIAKVAVAVMFLGMELGWFRGDSDGPYTLGRFFNSDTDDARGARNIINGDVSSMGNTIAEYHYTFLNALQIAVVYEPDDQTVQITAPPGIIFAINGKTIG